MTGSPAFEDWLERKLDGLAPGIRADAEAWLRTLHDGGPRSRPRDASSVRNYMHYARPLLLAWSSRYGHLREVSREDVMDALEEVHGSRRSNVLVALRSLFAFCKKRKTIFRSPVQGIRVGDRTWGVIQPLSQDEIDQAAAAAATPEARLVVVLAAMHAVRAKAIREIRLDDVDLGNRRIVIGGRARPLDDLTREVLLEWLAHRAARWPSTANPHLLVNQQSANGTGPVGIGYLYKTVLRGKAATLERLRVDRQLQEALAVGPDPLHLASMFGLDPKTAIRYAENARQLLVTAAEEQDPARAEETHDQAARPSPGSTPATGPPGQGHPPRLWTAPVSPVTRSAGIDRSATATSQHRRCHAVFRRPASLAPDPANRRVSLQVCRRGC